MNVPDDLRYAASHEWIREDGTVGITDHAQAELTDIVYVELPEVGRVVKAGEAVAVVESVKAASDIYAPASGTVMAINHDLSSKPALLNSDPYGAGWLFRLEMKQPEEMNELKSPADYGKLIGG
jgi:glycine cleavage system H protein